MILYGALSDARHDSHFHVGHGHNGSSNVHLAPAPFSPTDTIPDYTKGLTNSPANRTAIRRAYDHAYGVYNQIVGYYTGETMPRWAEAQLLKVGGHVQTLRAWKNEIEAGLEAATADPADPDAKPRRKRKAD